MSTAFSVVLEGTQEVPPHASAASGLGTVVFDSTAITASYTFQVAGIDYGLATGGPAQTPSTLDDAISTHFHNEVRGVNGPVVFGEINPAQDNDDLSIVQNADGSWTITGQWETTDPANVSITNFADTFGLAAVGAEIPIYFNIHTNQFPGGEIRGQLLTIADDNDNDIVGTPGDDFLPGLGGDDVIRGLDGNDRLEGGDGDDRIEGGAGNDTIDGGAGNDRLEGGDGDDTILGGDGDDRIKGGDGNDTIDGGAGNDRIEGGDGDDVLFGGDEVPVEEVEVEDEDEDEEEGEAQDDPDADADDEEDEEDGHNDDLHGGVGYDVLLGGEGNDLLVGAAGDDRM